MEIQKPQRKLLPLHANKHHKAQKQALLMLLMVLCQMFHASYLEDLITCIT